MMLAQLVTEEAVSKRLEERAPRCQGLFEGEQRRRYSWTTRLNTLSRNETGRLKLEYLRGRREEDEGKSPSIPGENAGVDGAAEARIRNSGYNGTDPGDGRAVQ